MLIKKIKVIKRITSNKVIKNFSFLTLSNLLNQFILVFSSIKIARVLGPSEFGIYTYIFVQAYLYSSIAELGLKGISIRTIARNPQKSKSVFFSALSLQLVGLIISSSLLVLYESFNHSINNNLIGYVLINVYVINLWSSCEAVWQGYQRMALPAIVNISFSVVWLSFILASPSKWFTVEYLYRSYVIIQILQTVTLFFLVLFTKNILRGGFSLFKDSLKVIKECCYYYFNVLISLPANAMPNNFLELNSSTKELGYFNTSNRLISPVKLVMNLGLVAIFPNLSSLWTRDKSKLIKRLELSIPLLIVAFSVLCFSFVLVSREVVMILFGEKYFASIEILKFQTWFIYIFSLNSFIGTVWASSDKHKLLSTWTVANALIATPILYIGSKYGGIGLSYAFLIAYSVTFPFLYNSFSSSFNLKTSIKRELFLAITLFIISVVLPVSTNLPIRVLIIVVVVLLIFIYYYKGLRSYFQNKRSEMGHKDTLPTVVDAQLN